MTDALKTTRNRDVLKVLIVHAKEQGISLIDRLTLTDGENIQSFPNRNIWPTVLAKKHQHVFILSMIFTLN